MKQIAQTIDHNEAQKLKSRIESAGIPVVIIGGEAKYVYTAGPVAVFVAIDSQYNDALIVLEKPQHRAANPVDVDAFHLAVRQKSLLPAFITSPAFLTYAAIGGFCFFLIRAIVKA